MEQRKLIILSRHCLHRTMHCVSVDKSKGRQGKTVIKAGCSGSPLLCLCPVKHS